MYLLFTKAVKHGSMQKQKIPGKQKAPVPINIAVF